MTILHHIHHYGKIRFNETKKTLGVSEKVLSQQLKELTHDGLVQRIQYNTIPLKVEYILTPLGEDLIPATLFLRHLVKLFFVCLSTLVLRAAGLYGYGNRCCCKET